MPGLIRRRPTVLIALALLLAACAPGPTATATGTPVATATLPTDTVAATPSLPNTGSEPPATDAPPSPDASPTATPDLGVVPGSVNRTSLDVSATYRVNAALEVRTGELIVSTVIKARNVSGEPIDRLELNTVAARLGSIGITVATVDGAPVQVRVADQTISVPLGGILRDEASATVRIDYEARLQRTLDGSNWMFTRSNGTIALYRWIPWVSRAAPFDRPNIGDPFVTATSPEVQVELITDEPMVLAAPVAELMQEPAGSGTFFGFTAEDVRDVALVLAPDFVVEAAEVDGVHVQAFARSSGRSADRLLNLAVQALEAETALIGVPYPWPALTVAQTAGGVAMESPGLVFIPRDTDSLNLRYLVHHEVAHQWFYGLVGNDQQADPFADEAAADLLARTALDLFRSSRCARTPLDRDITAYTRACYYEVIYVQGGLLLDEIRELMGTDLFWSTLGAYVEANRGGISDTTTLLEALRAASPVDLLPLLRARFPDRY